MRDADCDFDYEYRDGAVYLQRDHDNYYAVLTVIDGGGDVRAEVNGVKVSLTYALVQRAGKDAVQIVEASEPLKAKTAEILEMMIEEVLNRGGALPF